MQPSENSSFTKSTSFQELPATPAALLDQPVLDPRAAAGSVACTGARLDELAILLDVDGTIVDIASTPSEVEASPALIGTLARLSERTAGAVALVSGRTVAELDNIFAPLRLPAAGGHGAEFRPVIDDPITAEGATPLDPEVKRRLAEIAAIDRRLLVEDKGYSLALHFRLVPPLQQTVEAAVAAILTHMSCDSIEVLRGKAVLEIKSRGFDKGSAVRRLMRLRPFAGRRPVFVGDDTTDESAFAVLPDFNGTGFSVGRPLAGVSGHFAAPRDVRDWLERVARADGPPAAGSSAANIG